MLPTDPAIAAAPLPQNSLLRALRDRLLDLVRRAHHADRGDAAVSFVLTLPIFLFIVGVIVQFVLIVNAKVILDHATQVAARSAMTCLPDEPTDDDRRTQILGAALMVLEPLSPKATASDETADTLASQLSQNAGITTVSPSFALRYAYAEDATSVSWTPDNTDYRKLPAQAVTVTVTYRFYLTVPGGKQLLGTHSDLPGGLTTGRTFTMSSTRTVITSPGRQAFGSDNTD